jgi:hypothetical protein
MKIMTSAVNVESVTQDAVAIATKATEIFLTDFARRAYELSDSNILDYDDITNLVHSDPRYDFIVDTTPKRIKFSDALKLIEQSKKRGPILDEAEEQSAPELKQEPAELEPESEHDTVEPTTTREIKEEDVEQNGKQNGTPDSSSRQDSVESPPPDEE